MSTKESKEPSSPLRAVLDTNVLISAAIRPEGQAGHIWDLARERRFQMLTSPQIVNELCEKLRTKFFWDDKRLGLLLRRLRRPAEIIVTTTRLSVVPDDPDDNAIIECAVDGKADIIVSGDNDLLRMKSYEAIPILHPNDFLHTLG
ncbi:MAG: putative toxin-antitoxin system toxin component, PIN family [Blastocatellia bacterium]